MGAVYQAKDLKRGKICAIKEMSLSMVSSDEQEQAIQNFKDEAKMLWALNHPNLPSFTGFFSQNQRYFLVMEYIDGYTLEDLLERNGAPFPERRVLRWARQLCDVLEYLHSQNPPIIFRDMKPGNIMLTREGQIKLIDFGIARFFRPTNSPDTQLLGTPGFAPPEQYGSAQTDERSDIYALGMTLFQLLTNTLSEKGFGLKDVRAINPQISPMVARALEKATALELEERYESVAAFRHALLDVGSFIFENGEIATVPEELAELCARYPEEAWEYLTAGEIESWLHDIGEEDLSRSARRIRNTGVDPLDAVEQFLNVVMGPNVRVRGHTPHATNGHNRATPLDDTGSHRKVARWSSQSRRGSALLVSPRTLDFGPVYPGTSPPLTITVCGAQEAPVSGTIRSSSTLIKLDRTHFDDVKTYVNVRVSNTHLRDREHFTGSIIISSDGEEMPDVVVVVAAEFQGGSPHHRAKTIVPDQDDEEYEDDLLPIVQGSQGMQALLNHSGPALAGNSELRKKYGGNGAQTGRWEPWPATPRQRLAQQRGLTFVAAFMLASLCYTMLAQFSPLPPNPLFTVLLAWMIPGATLGALLVNWNRARVPGEVLDRVVTGMASTFVGLSLIKIIWLVTLHADLGTLQLCVLLLIAASGATAGINAVLSERIIRYVSRALRRVYWPVMSSMLVFGALLGYFLAVSTALGFTVFGILVGIGVAAALLWRAERTMKQRRI